jgi:hypothetical protein
MRYGEMIVSDLGGSEKLESHRRGLQKAYDCQDMPVVSRTVKTGRVETISVVYIAARGTKSKLRYLGELSFNHLTGTKTNKLPAAYHIASQCGHTHGTERGSLSHLSRAGAVLLLPNLFYMLQALDCLA